jgi:hypothetical protein
MRTTTRHARRLLAAAAVLLAIFAVAFGCGPVLHPTGATCGGLTEADAAECEGMVCLVLNANEQGIPGLCSAPCSTNEDCTPHDRCVSIDNQTFCLRACATDDDCYDNSVCRLFAVGNPTRFCLADPL